MTDGFHLMTDVLLHTVQATIDRHRMLATGDIAVLAVSGGVDSMVMLHLLLRLRSRYRISLHVAHLNHNLRETESAQAAEFVRGRCQACQVPVTIMTAGRATLREERTDSLQAAARDLRYRFLRQVADEQGANRIVLGHHRHDQAETVLMNLLRGSGARGLGGIPPVRGRIIRPMIDCSREEIEQYARQEGIAYVEDSSNRDLSYSRNRIRLGLLPELAKRYNPRVVHALANTATILEAEDSCLNEIAETARRAALIAQSHEQSVLSVPGLAALPTALRWRVIRRSVEELRRGRSGLTFQQVLVIDRLVLTEGAQGVIHASGRLRVRRAGEHMILSMGEGCAADRITSIPLVIPGLTAIAGSSFILRSDLLDEWSGNEPSPDPWTALLDADRAGHELYVRGWEEGDRFVPLGLDGRKKLQDFFVDEKVPRDRRGSVPLVVSGGRIAWVVGLRVDERFKVSGSTRRVLRLRVAATGEQAAGSFSL